MRTRLVRLAALLVALMMAGCPPATRPKVTEEDTKVEDAQETDLTETVTNPCGDINVECPNKGICAGKVLPVCKDGAWKCEFAAVKDYAEEDETCDGLDNDCDGIPDTEETFSKVSIADMCEAAKYGVCAEAGENDIKVACVEDGGKFEFQCDYSKVLDYVEDERYSTASGNVYCDGLDNDCDDEIDEFYEYRAGLSVAEFEAAQFGPCPSFEGVCLIDQVEGQPQVPWAVSGDVMFRCKEGVFECSMDQIEDYEAKEQTCDKLDNDCDGKVDEDLGAENSTCLSQGVCKDVVKAHCIEGEWVCDYTDVLKLGAFQYVAPDECVGNPDPLCGAELMCDGLDNDCDGKADEGLSWPYYPDDCTDGIDNDGNGSKDCEDPLCAQYHESCQGSQPPVFTDCPVTVEKIIKGQKLKFAVVDAFGLPLLPGVCARDGTTGVSKVRTKCTPVLVGDEVVDTTWKCNYDDVPGYVPEESYAATGEAWICDGLDNDCDGDIDDPGEIIVTDDLSVTTCRFLGECANNAAAYCNSAGVRPGQWTCEYNVGGKSTVEVPQTCNPDGSSCLWEELACDGLDNDCDGLSDELLDGRGLEVETACGPIMGKGVCLAELLDTKCVTVRPGERAFVCDLDDVPLYAPVEDGNLLLCDSKDNDCDDLIDEGIVASDPSDIEQYTIGCMYKGVCATGTVCACQGGAWIANYSQVPFFGAGYNFKPALSETYVEVACDGKDNDCDGLVDEALDVDLEAAGQHNPKLKSGCPLKGVCQNTIKWGCQDGGWFCDTTAVIDYESVETKCDTKDNDCDGLVDENLTAIGPSGANCKNKGVCAGPGVSATCQNGLYLCYYDGVQHYQDGKETICDGRDNDCDGETDEELDWVQSLACNRKGVCESEMLEALCLGASGWQCLYSLLPDYQPDPENRCDQKDNDCDGLVDEAACNVCQQCSSMTNCISGVCNTSPLGDKKFCSSSSSTCIYVDPYTGLCTTAADGATVCGTTTKPYLCAAGTWYGNIPQCSGLTPICLAGQCKTCVPNTQRCDGNSISKCSADGSQWVLQGSCTSNEVCLGQGVCVTNAEILVSPTPAATQSMDNSPKVAGRKTGGFVVVYETDRATGGDTTDIVMRLYNANMQAVGGEVLVNSDTGGFQGAPDVAASYADTGGFIVVWESLDQDGDSWGVYGQRFNDTGGKVGDEFLVNTTTLLDQKRPSVTVAADGSFVVGWESGAGADTDSYGVYARRFDKNGVPLGDEFVLNTTMTNLQTNVELATRASSGFAAVWSSANQDGNNYAAIAQYFNSTMTKVGVEFMLNTYFVDAQRNPVVGGFTGERAGYSAVAWESNQQDGFGAGVFLQYYGTAGDPLLVTGERQVNTVTLGNQRDPALAVLDNNVVAVVWESVNLTGESAGSLGVAARLFDATAQPLNTNEWLVNQTTANEQNNPDVAMVGDKGYVVVWSSYQTIPPSLSIFARVFKAP